MKVLIWRQSRHQSYLFLLPIPHRIDRHHGYRSISEMRLHWQMHFDHPQYHCAISHHRRRGELLSIQDLHRVRIRKHRLRIGAWILRFPRNANHKQCLMRSIVRLLAIYDNSHLDGLWVLGYADCHDHCFTFTSVCYHQMWRLWRQCSHCLQSCVAMVYRITVGSIHFAHPQSHTPYTLLRMQAYFQSKEERLEPPTFPKQRWRPSDILCLISDDMKFLTKYRISSFPDGLSHHIISGCTRAFSHCSATIFYVFDLSSMSFSSANPMAISRIHPLFRRFLWIETLRQSQPFVR